MVFGKFITAGRRHPFCVVGEMIAHGGFVRLIKDVDLAWPALCVQDRRTRQQHAVLRNAVVISGTFVRV